MLITATTDSVNQFQFISDLRAGIIDGLIVVGFLFGIVFIFATLFRVMKQLTNNPIALLQHKLIKWLYIACLVIVSLIGLVMIVAGGTGFVQMLFGGSNLFYSHPVQIRLWIAFQVAFFFIVIMAWILPICDKLLSKFKKIKKG